jgi:hypothetical protein
MKNLIKLFSLASFLLIMTSCSKPNNWEYKTIYFDSERFDGKDKGYTKTDEFFKNSVSNTYILPSDAELNKLGKDGWEIASTYLEMETVFPNLLASGDGVAGLQPNTRPQRLVVIFKRPAKK